MNEERPIEKLLRRYAKKRRDDAAAPELHPATRRLLQGEVARQYSKSAADAGTTSFAQTLRKWLPQLGWATAVILAVGIGAWTLFNKEERQFAQSKTDSRSAPVELAKNEPAPEAAERQLTARDADFRKELALSPSAAPRPDAADAKALAPATAPAGNEKFYREVKTPAEAAATLSAATQSPAAEAPTTLKDAPPPAPTVATASDYAQDPARSRAVAPEIANVTRRAGAPNRSATPTPAQTGDFEDRAASADKLKADAIATGRTSVTLSNESARGALFAGGSERDKNGALTASGARLEIQKAQSVSQAYANVQSATRYKSTAAKRFDTVLENFQIEQTGNQVRVIDGDGSTYQGELFSQTRANEELKKGASQLKQEVIGQDAYRADGTDTYAYRVSGTNRTLNQRVEFQWNFVAATNAVVSTPGLGGKLGTDEAKRMQLSPAVLQNSDVSGEVKIDARPQMKLKAVPVK